MVTAVFNTSPLIFLTKLGFMESSLALFDRSSIPRAVVEEIEAKKDKVSENILNMVSSEKIQVSEIKLVALAESYMRRIGKGESQAIVLAMETKADYIILDDFVARREAERLGLKAKGTLAVVRKLREDGKIQIENLEKFYSALKSINFRVKKRLFYDILTD